MRTIWKYEFYVESVVVIEMPRGAKVLPYVAPVSSADSTLLIWAVVDDEQPKEERTFYIISAEQEIPADVQLDYVGTAQHRYVQLDNTGSTPHSLVWHVFERNLQREQMLADNLEALKAEMDRWSKTWSQR